MRLSGIGFVVVFLAFLAVVLAVGLPARGSGTFPAPARRVEDDAPLVDEVGPYEVPDESSPSRSDD